MQYDINAAKLRQSIKITKDTLESLIDIRNEFEISNDENLTFKVSYYFNSHNSIALLKDRSIGNKEILDVFIETLEEQLIRFEKLLNEHNVQKK